MAEKQTGIMNIVMDAANLGTLRPGMAEAAWEDGVRNALNTLNNTPPYHTSRNVLRAVSRSGRKTVIEPGAKGADAGPTHWEAATSPGGDVLGCAGPQTGTKLPDKGPGTGSGSDTVIRFVAQDWSTVTPLVGGPEEPLLHELVHALRQQRGKMQCAAMPAIPNQTYHTVEELYAYVITNIYRSERGGAGAQLLADHTSISKLLPPLDNEEQFYAKWKSEINLLVQDLPDLCTHLAVVNCKFNPLRAALRKRYSAKELVERHNELLAPLKPTLVREVPF
jgi:hypothetical protein